MKMHRRLLPLILGLLLSGSPLFLAAETPISISTIEELQRIGNEPGYPLYGSYVLTGDIDASATAEWNDGKGFIPIGKSWTGFSGVFDGRGYVVRDLVVFRSGYWEFGGLFDTIGPSGVVRNVGLEGGRIDGESYAGALVGLNGGFIFDCYARVPVIGERAGGLVGVNWGEISSSHASGAVEGFLWTGGLAGDNYGSIAYCFGEGAVYAHWGDAGGLVGVNSGKISQSYAAGTVTGRHDAGGLVGSNWSREEDGGISDCYAVGAVVGLEIWRTAGGLAGSNHGEIARCYAAGSVVADRAGGLVGEGETEVSSFWDVELSGIAETEGAGGSGRTTEQMMSQATFEGWDFEKTWTMMEGETYPSLRGIGSPSESFRINVSGANGTVDRSPVGPDHLPWSVVQLNALAGPGYVFSEWIGITNRGNTTVRDNPISLAVSGEMTIEAVFLPAGPKEVNTAADLARIGTHLEWPLHGSYVLTTDLDASETAAWNDGAGFVPIGSERIPFDGHFDGQGHVIRNLTINRPGESGVGLFRMIGAAGEVRNVGLRGGGITGKDDVGALAGEVAGQIFNCFSTAFVKGEGSLAGGLAGRVANGRVANSYAGGTIWGRGETGGLVGGLFGGVIIDSFANGIVVGGAAAGGLVGRGYEGEITNSYAVGHVYGIHGVARGISGRLSGGIVLSNSYWDVETTGQDDSYGWGGRSTAEMMSKETYSDWDFEATWGIVEGASYPCLRVLVPAVEMLSVTVEAVNGSVHRFPEGPDYDRGSLVWLTAEAEPGYEFAGWAGDDLPGHLLLRANPLPVTVSESTTWTAVFAPAAPREISSVEDLAKIGRDPEWPLHWAYYLSGDIDASGAAGWNDGAGFEPIGSDSPFTGHFDGRGHAIHGLVINRPDQDAIGLFGVIDRPAVVENLVLDDGTVLGGNVGALAGVNKGTVERCFSSTDVSGVRSGGLIGANEGAVSRSGATGNVLSDQTAGGLVASNRGQIFRSYATGRVSGNFYVGGLIGENESNWFDWENPGVLECFAAGTVIGNSEVGGLVGVNSGDGSIADCFALGFVAGEWSAGGLVGEGGGGEITRSYAAGRVSGDNWTGGLTGYGAIPSNYWDVETTGQADSGDGTWGKSTEAMMTQATFAGWDFEEVWILQEGLSYPRLRGIELDPEDFPLVIEADFGSVSRNPVGPQYSPLTLVRLTAEPDAGYAFACWVGENLPELLKANPLAISVSKPMTLRAVFLPAGAKEVNGIADLAKIGHDPEWPLHWTYVLTADIDASETAEWDDGAGFLAIGEGSPFMGIFDGQGHRILGLKIDRTGEPGRGALFSEIGPGAVVRNLGVEGGSIVNFRSAAGLAMGNYGTIANCYTALDVTGEREAAGLVSSNHGEIRNSYSMSRIFSAMERPFEEGMGGGLVVFNKGVITNSYAAGEVFTPGGRHVFGGLVTVNSGEVISSFWDREATGIAESHSGRGLRTEQMKSAVVFQNAGWAGGGWTHDDGADYPRLAWENEFGVPIPDPEALDFSGSGTFADPYLIQTVAAFTSLAWHASVLDKHFEMTADLDLAGADLHPIGEFGDFTGTFNGGGFVVAHGVIDRPGSELAGLFNRVGPGGRIQFLGAESMHVTGRARVGLLAGTNSGAIISCYGTGDVNQAPAAEEYSGQRNAIGGLVGENKGSIFRTYANVAVAGRGESFVGGLVGRSDWEAEIAESYSCGPVTGDYGAGNYYEPGGFVGEGYGVTSFWDTESSGQASPSGATGKSTAEMMREETFTEVGWDFANVWTIDEGLSYPTLRRGANEVIAPATFSEWVGQTTLPPGERAISADPGGFGITNLERYAFGLDPNGPSRSHLPVGSIGKRYGYEFLTIGYWESAHAADIDYVVEASGDLKTWEVLSESRRVEQHRDADWRLVTSYDRVTINGEDRRFLRVRIEMK